MLLSKIHSEPDEIQAALAALGLTSDPIWNAIKGGLLARDSCTENDPPFFPGIFQWGRTVRILREETAPLGWSRSDEGNFCTAVEPEGKFAIAVASGCENTGCKPPASPTTRRRKGPSTADAVNTNAQLSLFPEPAPAISASKSDRATWILLFYRDREEVRAELSLPDSIGDDGHIDGWRERIILGALPLDGNIIPVAPDFGPDPIIDVRRRA
ncbi:hypothetical protein [Methylocystis iwaonis]|uniref:Uncharacterized protein n=1 Tax=Methylocystis iwaonis TaxID=2885079 RepID=A0ABM8EFF8_9HYPH|nr:hypothetical protein [Methylocystis iwaonis]BDV36692.1 hypothetical protein SS37A_42220 [Methylocystis iwaonis]